MQPLRVAINGFGRIGRSILRAFLESARNDIEIVVINAGLGTVETNIHLLKYDSTHGQMKEITEGANGGILIKGTEIPIIFEQQPSNINWLQYKVDIVMECSGIFTQRAAAAQHIDAGAKMVIISAPSKDSDRTVVYGVNEDKISPDDRVISIGSCTTNCLAPIAKVIHKAIGIESAFMTTIHAYTNDQNILDGLHKDMRRARTAGLSMIPTSTGAASAIGLVLPELAGKFAGVAVRVPTHNVSMIDLTFTALKETSITEINNAIINKSAKSKLSVLGYTSEELVSVDFNHDSRSAIFDLTQTEVVNRKLCRVAAWYDNEWGFSNRMLDVAALYRGFINERA